MTLLHLPNLQRCCPRRGHHLGCKLYFSLIPLIPLVSFGGNVGPSYFIIVHCSSFIHHSFIVHSFIVHSFIVHSFIVHSFIVHSSSSSSSSSSAVTELSWRSGWPRRACEINRFLKFTLKKSVIPKITRKIFEV